MILRSARKLAILIVGLAVVAAGIALLALPGPGVLVIIVGLVILSTEFEWAQKWLDYVVERAAGATTKVQSTRGGRLLLALSGCILITAGVVVIVWFSQWIVVGISLILAGIIGMCTLHPRVHDWVAERALTGIDHTDDVPA